MSILSHPQATQISPTSQIFVPAPQYRVVPPETASTPDHTTDASHSEQASQAQEIPTAAASSLKGTSGFFYLPNFISEQEEAYLIERILQAPQPKWKHLQNRRLQYWGGALTGKGKNVLLPDPQGLPAFLASYPDLVGRLESSGAFAGTRHERPNHCLINEYLPGQGIMPHDDGPAYEPVTATISLGSHALLDIYEWIDDASLALAGAAKGTLSHATGEASAAPAGATERRARGARAPDPTFSLLQEPRSLLITRGTAYHDWLHGIADRAQDTDECLARVANVSSIQDLSLRQKVQRAQQTYPHLVPKHVPTNTATTPGSCGVAEQQTPASSSGSQVRQEKHEFQEAPGLPRDTRYSLTFRDVAKVSNALGGMAASRLGIS